MSDTAPRPSTQGLCSALFAYDVGLAIDLDRAERRVREATERGGIRARRRTPQYFEFRPAPLRVTQEAAPIALGAFSSEPRVEVTLFDFGAVSVCYRFPVPGRLDDMLTLAESLFENAALLEDSRTRVAQLVHAFADAVERPTIAAEVEDYVIFRLDMPLPEDRPGANDSAIAQVLRCERAPLAQDEVRDATAQRLSYTPEDIALVDWNAALVAGREMDDVQAVLEFVNVALLEMRLLDRQLDRALDQAYDSLARRSWARLLPGYGDAQAVRIGQMQVDSAIAFERVTNTLKLIGDQYLARVYRLAAQRFHLESWDRGIQRKLQTLESIYEKITDRVATRRLELLEWIIIVLIAISILLPFIPGVYPH
jgi:hypothetical protein